MQSRHWLKKFAGYHPHASPGNGQLKPEQLEIARVKREMMKLAGRDMLRGARCLAEFRMNLFSAVGDTDTAPRHAGLQALQPMR